MRTFIILVIKNINIYNCVTILLCYIVTMIMENIYCQSCTEKHDLNFNNDITTCNIRETHYKHNFDNGNTIDNLCVPRFSLPFYWIPLSLKPKDPLLPILTVGYSLRYFTLWKPPLQLQINDLARKPELRFPWCSASEVMRRLVGCISLLLQRPNKRYHLSQLSSKVSNGAE